GHVHGAELDQPETPSRHAYPLLDEEHRSARIDLDHQSRESEQWGKENQTDPRDQKADATTGRQVEARLLEVAGEDQRTRGESLDGELAGEALVDVHAVLDDASSNARLQEIANRQARAPFGHRDDDPM